MADTADAILERETAGQDKYVPEQKDGTNQLSARHTTAMMFTTPQTIELILMRAWLTAGLFLAVVNENVYLCSIDGGTGVRTITSRLARTCRYAMYDLTHAVPLGTKYHELAAKLEELELDRREGPIVDGLRRLLGGDGSGVWRGQDLLAYLRRCGQDGGKDPEWPGAVREWLATIDVKHVVLPIPRFADIVSTDIPLFSPAQLGEVINGMIKARETRELVEGVQKPRNNLMMLLVICMVIVVALGAYLYIENEEAGGGGLDLGGFFGVGGTGGGAVDTDRCSFTALTTAYPDPLDLAVAEYLGEIHCPNMDPQLRAITDAQDPAQVQWAVDQRLASSGVAGPGDGAPDVPGIQDVLP